jgi:cytochrome c-type biogenesis protein CcmH/NrfF
MDQTEAKARIKHVMRTLITQGNSTTEVSKLTTEAFGEIVKETIFKNRHF